FTGTEAATTSGGAGIPGMAAGRGAAAGAAAFFFTCAGSCAGAIQARNRSGTNGSNRRSDMGTPRRKSRGEVPPLWQTLHPPCLVGPERRVAEFPDCLAATVEL